MTNFHHIPGVAEHSLGMKRLEDAPAVCDRVLSCLERASTENDGERRKALLTFVVAGGGYTGVETMAAVNDLVRDKAAQYQIAGDAPGPHNSDQPGTAATLRNQRGTRSLRTK